MSVNDGLKKNFELRAIAREKLKGRWLYAILICFIASVITGVLGCIPFVNFLSFLITRSIFKLLLVNNPYQ